MTDKNLILNNDFEDSFEKSLKSLGYLFPTTEDEVKLFEDNNIIEEIPQSYCSASELLKKFKTTSSVRQTKHLHLESSIENLARAARNGTGISDDILKKMKSDRDKAENDQK
jgi:hypothetical protein